MLGGVQPVDVMVESIVSTWLSKIALCLNKIIFALFVLVYSIKCLHLV